MAKKVSTLAKLLAVCVAAGAVTFYVMLYDAAKTQFSTWKLGWAPSPCSGEKTPTGYSAFAMHVFFMGMAFGLMAPIGAVTYILVRDTLGLSQTAAKVVHGICQLGAFVCSVLGYTQMYYAHGADCKGIKHFQSVHSYVGIVVLVIFWFQLPSALVVFTNNSVFPHGGAARKTFLKYHVFLGSFGVFAGLATTITGILALTAKNTDPVSDSWYMYARTATAAFVTIFFLALSLFEAKSEPISSKAQTTPDDPLLVANNNH